VRVAIYARVSTETQEQRGTIGSQLEVLRAKVVKEGDELVAELCDEGYSGARLDRPGLDSLRDQAEAGAFEAVWCLSPDRLARSYAYQMLVLDELARFGVSVRFTDTPPLEDDPQARLLVQVQGVIAEYEKVKIAERNRRGKLWRSKVGEVVSWRVPYGYRRVPRTPDGQAYLVVFEPEAAVVRRIFDDYVSGGHSIRDITRRLNADSISSPTGKPTWGPSMTSRLLHNDAYIGKVYFNMTETILVTSPNGRTRQRKRPRPREEWIEIPCPPIVSDAVFEAAQAVTRDNSMWSPRNLKDEAWLLRGLVVCGVCQVGTSCLKRPGRGRDGTENRYYRCYHNDALKAGGEARRCPERNIRSEALDAFVFAQVRAALLSPHTLHTGENALLASNPLTADELLGAELVRLERKLESNKAERRRLADLYQAGLLELTEVQRRVRDVQARHRSLEQQRRHLITERHTLAADNRLRQRVADFAHRIARGIDKLNFSQRQQLLRLVVERVVVTGWQVEIHLRIPLDDYPDDGDSGDHRDPSGQPPRPSNRRSTPVSNKDGLRSARRSGLILPTPPSPRCHHPSPPTRGQPGHGRPLVGRPAAALQAVRSPLGQQERQIRSRHRHSPRARRVPLGRDDRQRLKP
jgi:site-specific DNA recombinase